MFEINFRIFKDLQLGDFVGEYGYFNFVVDDESYGIIIEKEIEAFSESLYDWFSCFLKALLILETENYVLINDIESFNSWIELNRKDEYVYISNIAGEKVGAGGLIRKEKLSDADDKFWKNKEVLFSDFKAEILEKSEGYLTNLDKLNALQNGNVLELSDLVTKVKSF